MKAELDAILARARRTIEEMERLSAMAERLSSEARKVLVSLEPPQSSSEKNPSSALQDEPSRKE
jgi:hypothetical protein